MDPSTHWVATVNSDGSSSVKVITSKRRAKDFILGPKSKEDMKLAKARLRAAKVPKPQLSPLISLPDKEAFLEYCRAKAHTWVTNADTFLLSVDINDLKARPKNTEDLKSSAAQRIRSMETQPDDARSAIYKDKNGITLACVLAWRVPGCPKLTDTDYPGAQGRTLTDVIGSNPSQDDYDGLNESLIKRALEAAQTLHSVLHPITPDRDIRHNEEEKYMVYSPDGGSSEISERAGVTHLVQCWTMQGHKRSLQILTAWRSQRRARRKSVESKLSLRHIYRAEQLYEPHYPTTGHSVMQELLQYDDDRPTSKLLPKSGTLFASRSDVVASHWVMNTLCETERYTIFIRGFSSRSLPILVTDDTTVSDVYDHLELLGLVPSRLHQLYFTHLGRRVAWVDEMRSLGLGALSHLHLHIRRLGGTMVRMA
ncbi:hypothetical protein B0H14DRAFT_3580541 [Mycena olivaceomarginata]|nr:hypothetical protein B0H14DRAFT_3580541 [Mycena olivaceomarginata]